MKNFIKFLFKGLVNNEEVIYQSKHQKWWTAILVLLFSIVVAVVPSFVQIAQVQGSEVLTTSQNASLDVALNLVSEHLEENNMKIVIDEEGCIDINKAIPDNQYTKYEEDSNGNKTKVAYEYSVVAQGKELLVFTICSPSDVDAYKTLYSEGKKVSADAPSAQPRSSLIITETNIYITTYLTKNIISEADGSITEAATPAYEYFGANISAKGTDINSFSASNNYNDCTAHWEKFLVDAYRLSKTQYLWTYSGILAAINLGVALLVSLLTMILTRLKSATGDRLNYLEALKIICFASLAPALVSILLGFFISSMAQVGFVLCLGLRTTFLGMKAANPVRN